MASVKLMKKSAMKKAAAPGAKAVPGDLILFDNQDDTATISGVDSAGNAVDISTVATIAVTSSDPASLSVDPPTGLTFKMHGLKPTVAGSPVVVTVVATWNDASAGPFTVSLPCDLTGSVAAGITITPGVPTIR